MQTRIGKRRGYASHREAQTASSARLQVIITLVLLLSSCSLFKSKNYADENYQNEPLKRAVGRVCLSGEGKGQSYIMGQKGSYSFESNRDQDVKTFAVGLHIPLMPEEVLIVDYKRDLYSGSIMDRAKREKQKNIQSSHAFDSFKSFLRKEAQILRFLESDLNSCSHVNANDHVRGTCKFEKEYIQWRRDRETFELTSNISRDSIFHVLFQGDSPAYFNHVILTLKDAGNTILTETQLKLNTCDDIK